MTKNKKEPAAEDSKLIKKEQKSFEEMCDKFKHALVTEKDEKKTKKQNSVANDLFE